MRIDPNINLLASLRADNPKGKYSVLLSEAVDNSFDADAGNIWISMGPEYISFKDDGVGIARNRIRSLFELGNHGEMPSTQIGIFGVGLKQNAICAGNILQVDSTSTDGIVSARANWKEMVDWDIPDPRWSKRKGQPTGTTIKISDLRWSVRGKDIEEAEMVIARRFYPAIEEGKKIFINDAPMPLIGEPAIVPPTVNCSIDFGDGRIALVHAGVLADPKETDRKLTGVHISYKHRVVIGETNIGCGESSYRSLFARVRLEGSWALTKFKDDIEEKQRDELGVRLENVFAPILKKCDDDYLNIRDESIANKLNDMLPEELHGARPRRVNPEGNLNGKKKGKPHRKTNDPDGDGPARTLSNRGVRVKFEDSYVERYGFGRFVRGKPSLIELSKDCNRVEEYLKKKDTQSLLLIALAIYEAEKNQKPEHRDQAYLEGFEPFGKRYWDLMAKQRNSK